MDDNSLRMRMLVLLSLLVAHAAIVRGQGQAPPTPPPARQAKPTPAPAPATPRATQPAPRRAAQPAGRSGMAITVTDMQGATIAGIDVSLSGPTSRSSETNAGGQLNFPGLQPGTYRLHFSGDTVTPFEREVTLRPGQIADLDITLSPAPPKPEPPPPVTLEAAAPPAAPPGAVQTLSIVDLLEKDFVGRQPRRESLLSCSGNLRSTMIQLNEPQPERLYDDAEAAYYVLAGEGAVRLNGRETPLRTNGFVSVPRGTPHSFIRKGSRPFVILSVLGGEPCEQVR